MKDLIKFLIIAVFFSSCSFENKNEVTKEGKLKGEISLSGAFALYPISLRWGREFKKLHPDVRVDISAGGAGKGMADVLSGNVYLGMLSRDVNPSETERGAFSITVAKDAVIPTINVHNPSFNAVKAKGMTKEDFKNVWITGKAKSWGDIAGDGSKHPIQIFTRSDAAGAPETWAKYLGKKQEDLQGVGIFGDPGLAEAVKEDKNGIGFNNVVYVYDMGTKMPYNGISVIPIDINENGKIDPEENFYENMDSLMLAIANDVYPSPPARDLYFVSKGKVTDPVIKAFLKWVLTEGQQYLPAAGYVRLTDEKIKEGLKNIEQQ